MSELALLVNPWIYDFAAYDLWVRPLGLLNIASALKSAGVTVRLIDCLDRTVARAADPTRRRPRAEQHGCGHFRWEPAPEPSVFRNVARTWKRYGVPSEHFEAQLGSTPTPAVVLVGCTMTYWYPGAQEVIARVRRRWPNVPVLLGGIYPTLCREHAANHSGANAVVTGGDLQEALRRVGRWLGADLDVEPAEPLVPDYGLLRHFGAAAVLTRRGCPFRCSYCASHRIEPRLVRYDPVRVADMLLELCRREAIRDIALYDDALLLDAQEHLLPLLEGVRSRGLELRWHTPNGVHPRFLTPEVAGAMRRAGFVTICLSYESSSPRRQRDSDGKVSTEALAGAMRALCAAGYRAPEVTVYALMGLPEQGEAEVEETLRTIHALGARSRLARWSPIPGTEEFERWDDPLREQARVEPLLHNNTALPYLSGRTCLGPEAYQRMQDLSLGLARELDAG